VVKTFTSVLGSKGVVSWSQKLGQRFRNYKLRNNEKDQMKAHLN